jgi:hypothetical protein
MANLIILIPSYNDYVDLRKIILKLKKKYKIIVINDNSTDQTNKFLVKNKIINIKNLKNIGYEKSLIRGFKYIKKKRHKEKYILTMDADGEHPLNKIDKIYSFIESKNLDFVIGTRNKLNRSLEYFTSFLFSLLFELKDPLSGFKIYRKECIFTVLKHIRKDCLLVDIIFLFKINKFKVGFMKLDNLRKFVRKSSLGNSFRLLPKFIKIYIGLFNYITNTHNNLR